MMTGPGTDHPTEHLSFEAKVDEIPRLNDWLDGLCDKLGIAREPLNDLKLCINEAAANVLNHGSGGATSIDVVAWRENGAAVVEISDTGTPFDPTQLKDRTKADDLKSEALGGWGIPLMRKMSDRMTYRFENGRNHVRFEKRL